MPLPRRPSLRHRYCIQSKSCFLARIQMLDGSIIECTWHVDSKGRDCLEALAKRLDLTESQYFGLWFVSKSQHRRWVSLEKALKKQLDKFAGESLLHFGVMFYVPDTSILKHEVTRFQYYLQVKKNILDGDLQCPLQQAVELAGLAVQADLGDFDQFRFSEYLKECVLFPVNWSCTGQVLAEWTQRVTEEHKLNCGMCSAEAVLLYIKEAEKLEGFGWESFAGKDSCSSFSCLGVSFSGVFVKTKSGKSFILYRWNDIQNITHTKSAVEMYSKDGHIRFQMSDAETAKYVSRLLTAKQKFYSDKNFCSQPASSPSVTARRTTWDGSTMPRPSSHSLKPNHSRYGGRFQDTFSCSQGSSEGPDTSECSVDPGQLDISSLNGTAHNSSLYRTPNCARTVPQNTDVLQPKCISSQRHGAIVAPSYRPTPDYECVMRQKQHVAARGQHSLPFSSQAGVRERTPYPGPFTSQVKHSLSAAQANLSCRCDGHINTDSASIHRAGTLNMTKARLQGARGHAVPTVNCHTTHSQMPYSCVCPASSVQDPPNYHVRGMWGSSPDLIFRKLQAPVKAFQADSYAAGPRSMQGTGEHVQGAARPGVGLSQRHSLEVMSSMVKDMEAMAFRALNAPPLRRNTMREQTAPLPSRYSVRQKSEATPNPRPPSPRFSPGLNAQQRATLAQIPNRPPPEYPGTGRIISNDALKTANIVAKTRVNSLDQYQGGGLASSDQTQLIISSLGPSMSEPNLPTVKERVKKKVVKERPVSEMFSMEDSIVEREIIQRTREKQKMEMDSVQMPLKMVAARTGSSLTGLPVLESQQGGSFSKLSTDEQCRTLENKLEDEQITREYGQIPQKAADMMVTSAALPCNRGRNRHHSVLPYDKTRVELEPSQDNPTGYINASHIEVLNQGEQWRYIATQDPMPNTCQDFWQMVWEQGAHVIAMVTVEEDPDSSQLCQYWPLLGSRQNPATHGPLQVTTKFHTDLGSCSTTGLTVKHMSSGQERVVWHLQYCDRAKQEMQKRIRNFLSYLEELYSVQSYASRTADASGTTNPPVVVHCSSGSGWTGVVILAQLMIRHLKQSQSLDVPSMLAHLRQQRMHMVHTISLYRFVYQVLIYLLKTSYMG